LIISLSGGRQGGFPGYVLLGRRDASAGALCASAARAPPCDPLILTGRRCFSLKCGIIFNYHVWVANWFGFWFTCKRQHGTQLA
jgi:hypothetical protein